jgi:hypothetical protein
MGSSPQASQPNHRESGVAIVVGLWFSVIVVGIVIAGSAYLSAHSKKTRNSFIARSQAIQIARSGLTESLNWLRRQTSQPVEDFAPQYAPSATPPVLDTIDPDIGLVREFRIAGKQWGRYEVWKEWDADPNATRRAWRQQVQCEDISEERMAGSDGAIWRLRSVGYVYTLVDPSKAYNVAPNVVLSREMLQTEVQRLSLNLPGEAALNVGDGNSAHVNTNGRIVGGNAGGIHYPRSTGTPTTGSKKDKRVTGSPALSTSSNYDDSPEAVFGIGFEDLRSLADLIVTSESEFPNPVPNNSLVIVDVGTTMNWDDELPLRGSGIVIVLGHAHIQSGSNSNFSGLLYVDGNLTMRGPSDVRGAVVVTGNMTLQGQPDYATITFDGDVLDELRLNFGNYTRSNTLLIPLQKDY